MTAIAVLGAEPNNPSLTSTYTRRFTPPSSRELARVSETVFRRVREGVAPCPRDLWLLMQSEQLRVAGNEARFAPCIGNVVFAPAGYQVMPPMVHLPIDPSWHPMAGSRQHALFMAHRLGCVAPRPGWYCPDSALAEELMLASPCGTAAELKLPASAFAIELPIGVLELELSTGPHPVRVIVVADCDSSDAPFSYFERGRYLSIVLRCEEARNSRTKSAFCNLVAPLHDASRELAQPDFAVEADFAERIRHPGMMLGRPVTALQWRQSIVNLVLNLCLGITSRELAAKSFYADEISRLLRGRRLESAPRATRKTVIELQRENVFNLVRRGKAA